MAGITDFATHEEFFTFCPKRLDTSRRGINNVTTIPELVYRDNANRKYKFVDLKKYYRNIFSSYNNTILKKSTSDKNVSPYQADIYRRRSGSSSDMSTSFQNLYVQNTFPVESLGSMFLTLYALFTLVTTMIFLFQAMMSSWKTQSTKDQTTWNKGLIMMMISSFLGIVILALVWYNWNYPSDNDNDSGQYQTMLYISLFTFLVIGAVVGIGIGLPKVGVLFQTFPLKNLFTVLGATLVVVYIVMFFSWVFLKIIKSPPKPDDAYFTQGNIRQQMYNTSTFITLAFSGSCLVILMAGFFFNMKNNTNNTHAYLLSIISFGFWWIFPIVGILLHIYYRNCNTHDNINPSTYVMGGVLHQPEQGNQYLTVQPHFGFFTTRYKYQPPSESLLPSFNNYFGGSPLPTAAPPAPAPPAPVSAPAPPAPVPPPPPASGPASGPAPAPGSGSAPGSAPGSASGSAPGSAPASARVSYPPNMGSILDRPLSSNMNGIIVSSVLTEGILILLPVVVHMWYMIRMWSILNKDTSNTSRSSLMNLLKVMILTDLAVCLGWAFLTTLFMNAVSARGNIPVSWMCTLVTVFVFTYLFTFRMNNKY